MLTFVVPLQELQEEVGSLLEFRAAVAAALPHISPAAAHQQLQHQQLRHAAAAASSSYPPQQLFLNSSAASRSSQQLYQQQQHLQQQQLHQKQILFNLQHHQQQHHNLPPTQDFYHHQYSNNNANTVNIHQYQQQHYHPPSSFPPRGSSTSNIINKIPIDPGINNYSSTSRVKASSSSPSKNFNQCNSGRKISDGISDVQCGDDVSSGATRIKVDNGANPTSGGHHSSGGGVGVASGGVSDSGFTDKNCWSGGSMGTKTSSNTSSGGAEEESAYRFLAQSNPTRLEDELPIGGSPYRYLPGFNPGVGIGSGGIVGGFRDNHLQYHMSPYPYHHQNVCLCPITNTTDTLLMATSNTNTKTTTASANTVESPESVSPLEDELLHLLDVIQERGTRLRLELTEATQLVQLYSADYEHVGSSSRTPAHNLPNQLTRQAYLHNLTEEVHSDPTSNARSQYDILNSSRSCAEASGGSAVKEPVVKPSNFDNIDDIWPLSLPPYYQPQYPPVVPTGFADLLSSRLPREAPGYAVQTSTTTTPPSFSVGNHSPAGGHLVSSLITRASYAEKEATEAQQRLSDLHSCLNMVLGEKRRLERELRWRTMAATSTVTDPRSLGIHLPFANLNPADLLMDQMAPGLPRPQYPNYQGFNMAMRQQHPESYPPANNLQYPPNQYSTPLPYQPNQQQLFTQQYQHQHNPHSYPQSHQFNVQPIPLGSNNVAPSSTLGPSASSPLTSPSREQQHPVVLPRLLKIPIKNPSGGGETNGSEFRRAKSASSAERKHRASSTDSRTSDRRTGDSSSRRTSNAVSETSKRLAGGDRKNTSSSSSGDCGSSGGSHGSRSSTINSGTDINTGDNLEPVVRPRSKSMSTVNNNTNKSSINNKNNNTYETRMKDTRNLPSNVAATSFSKDSSQPVTSTTRNYSGSANHFPTIPTMGGSLRSAGASLRVVGGRVSVTPNRGRIAAILRESNVLELQRQLLHMVVEAEVRMK